MQDSWIIINNKGEKQNTHIHIYQQPINILYSFATWSALHKTSVNMIQLWMRRVFPPVVEFVQESKSSGSQNLVEVKHQRLRYWCPASHPDAGRAHSSSPCSITRVCELFPLEVVTQKVLNWRSLPSATPPLRISVSHSHTRFISCHFQLAAVDPKWGRSIPSMWMGTKVLCFLFVPFSNLTLGNYIPPLARVWFYGLISLQFIVTK